MINFNNIQLPDHSRIWVYQADRKLSPAEQSTILAKGSTFTTTWAAHGHDLMAELTIIADHFIIIILDEQVEAASGCSIDKSMRFILDLQKELGINFTNRLISALLIDEEVQLFTYAQVKDALQKGTISATTPVFDNTLQDLRLLKTSWLKPLKETWLKKLLEPQNVG
jgi:hypothetical protein